MKLKWEPIKNQKFDIGRTINFAKCDCEKCDYMHCPKNNYCVKMKQSKYSIEEFVAEMKDEIKKKGNIYDYLSDWDGMTEFIDACIGGFPKGTYWNNSYGDLELVTQNRGKYGPDFDTRVEIRMSKGFRVNYWRGCTETQEKFAQKLQKQFLKLAELCDEEE